MSAPPLKKGPASLIGGIAVGIAVVVLWTALARDLAIGTPIILACGVLLAIATAAWIRAADL